LFVTISGLAVAVGMTLPLGAAHANDGLPVTGDQCSNVGMIILTLDTDFGYEGTYQRAEGNATLITRPRS